MWRIIWKGCENRHKLRLENNFESNFSNFIKLEVIILGILYLIQLFLAPVRKAHCQPSVSSSSFILLAKYMATAGEPTASKSRTPFPIRSFVEVVSLFLVVCALFFNVVATRDHFRRSAIEKFDISSCGSLSTFLVLGHVITGELTNYAILLLRDMYSHYSDSLGVPRPS